MKKLFALMLTLAMLLTFVGCSLDEEEMAQLESQFETTTEPVTEYDPTLTTEEAIGFLLEKFGADDGEGNSNSFEFAAEVPKDGITFLAFDWKKTNETDATLVCTLFVASDGTAIYKGSLDREAGKFVVDTTVNLAEQGTAEDGSISEDEARALLLEKVGDSSMDGTAYSYEFVANAEYGGAKYLVFNQKADIGTAGVENIATIFVAADGSAAYKGEYPDANNVFIYEEMENLFA